MGVKEKHYLWGWLCVFLPHKWVWERNTRMIPRFNNDVLLGLQGLPREIGIYRCSRCGEISRGSARRHTFVGIDPDSAWGGSEKKEK